SRKEKEFSAAPRSMQPAGLSAIVDTTAPVDLEQEMIVPAEFSIEDDRGNIQKGDRVLLIVEDDLHYAKVLLEMAHAKGFKGVVAPRGSTALAMAREIKPD